MLCVAPIATHIPFTDGAVRARYRIGMTHDADDDVPGIQAHVIRRLLDNTEGLVSDDEALVSGRRTAIVAGDDLAIGSADAERNGANENRSAVGGRYPELLETQRIGNSRLDRQRSHSWRGHAGGLCR